MPTAPADGLKMADAERVSTERRELMERLVPIAEKDNENFLSKIKDRLDRVGIENPTVEVRFERLDIGAEAYVGNSGVPSVLNFYTNMIEGLLNKLHILPTRKQPINILNDISGIIKPNRMSLLLGPPGSGKTTLLLALAGKLSPELKVSGKVTYNGHEMNEFVPQRTSAYIGQNDVHIGEMTVRETLAFSARCQGVRSRYELLMELLRREKEANIKPDRDIDMFMKATSLEGHENMVTEYIMKILGLDVCADTMVGNAMLRGVSGGQKKRVTIGEMLVGPSRAFFMDEISTGLDSSTTFQIVNSVRQSVHVLGATALVALLQPAPETYDLFDDVILLSEGQIVYQGPRVDVLAFFESMGFGCPERKGVADFLQEVTSRKDQQQYWAGSPEEYRFIPVNEFADAFRSFHVGRRLAEELGSPFDRTKNHPTALTTSRYGVSKSEMLKACFDREYLLMKRNSFVYLFRLLKVALVSFIAMTVFFRVSERQDRQSVGLVYMGALFVGLITHLLIGFAEVSMTIVKFPVFYKQRDLLFFPAWTYALPTWILKIPVSFVECGVYVAMTYYVVGFDPNIHRMLRQFFIYTLVSQVASGLFRLVAATGRVMVVANTFSILALVLLLALGGFVTSRENIKKWWIWGYWASPLMYGQNAIAVNEFLGKKWLKVNLTESTETQGVRILESYGLFPEDQWFWIGVDGLLGYILLFNVLFIVALTYLNMIREQTVLSKETLEEKNANRTGQVTDPSSRGRMPTHVSEGSAGGETGTDMGRNKKKGMVLPFIPLSITFDDVKYSVDMPQEMKAQGVPGDKLAILKGLSGAFRPRVLTALMGPSGAGKTTLLDVLAGRKTGGYIEGRITISGYPKNQETFARVSGYCEQNDVHSPHVTVYESLVYSAWLRLSSEIDSKSRKVFIEEVMGLVELMPLRESLVGLPGMNGLSTEQRKRLTIAVELVANPSIIFMDEPTSGLDARAAAIVMRTARNIVDTGRTIVCTIHQPSIDIFESFDELFLMKRGGDEIYVGPLGHNSCYLINYFESINGVKRIRDGHNPATWMLEVTTSSQEEALGVNFSEVYKSSNIYRRNKDLINELSTPPPGSEDLHFPTNFPQPFLMQCMVCLWKQCKSYRSNPLYIAIRMLFTTIIALIYGTIFWTLGSKLNTQQDVLNAMGSIYLAVIFIGMQNAQTVQPIVDVERTVFYREKAAGMYSSIAYAFAQVVVEIPYTLLQSLLYCVLVYCMIDFDWTVAKFFWFLFFMFFTFLYFVYYGMMAVALTPNSSIATVVATTFYAIWNIFAGFIIPLPRIPVWWRWYYWACPVSWSVYGLNASQFGDDEHMMDNGRSVKEFLRSYMGYRHEFLGVVASVVVGFSMLFAFIFAIGIKYVNFQRR